MSGAPIPVNPFAVVRRHALKLSGTHGITQAGKNLTNATTLAEQKTILGINDGGTGDVVGPSSSTSGNLAVFADESGKLLMDGGPVPSGSEDPLPGAMFWGEPIDASGWTPNPEGILGETRLVVVGGVLSGYYGWTQTVVVDELLICLGTSNAYGGSNWFSIKPPTGGDDNVTLAPTIDLDCSTSPDFPAATKGQIFRVSNHGKIGGATGVAVRRGCMLICTYSTDAGAWEQKSDCWMVLQTPGLGLVLDYQGEMDCSTNPLCPACDPGDLYHVTVAGKFGGESGFDVVPGDALYARYGTTQTETWAQWGFNTWEIIRYVPNVSQVDATDLATCQTLVNELKARVNALLIELRTYGSIVP